MNNGITIVEFRVAMETYHARRLADCDGTRYSIRVPNFNVSGVDFIHSGSYYIVQRGHVAPYTIMEQAMAELGEKYPGGKHFWYGEIHSVRGLLTLSAMLEGRYSKEMVDKLVNETYQKLLDLSFVKEHPVFPFHDMHSPKMETLFHLLTEYSNIVNPFADANLSLMEPIQYLDTVDISISDTPRLTMSNSTHIHTDFSIDSTGWYYNTFLSLQKDRKEGSISMGHYYENGSNGQPIDEVVHLFYNANLHKYFDPDDIDLRISLKTGLAWKTYREEEATLATDEQIETMIFYLRTTIKKIKRKMIRKMILVS